MALKRQQAAEDAIALGLRAVATGDHRVALPQGPIVGGFCLPLYDQFYFAMILHYGAIMRVFATTTTFLLF